MPRSVELRLPEWLVDMLNQSPRRLASPEDRMRFVLELARRNVEYGTGGPFAAAVFEQAGGRLVAAAVNLVVPAQCSPAHAEIIALALAQQTRGTHDLGAAGLPAMELAASTEPCAMCLGAIPWSGVRSLLCGARGCDAEANSLVNFAENYCDSTTLIILQRPQRKWNAPDAWRHPN